jgi:N-acetyl-gamma-glutamyl-phosphate reductase
MKMTRVGIVGATGYTGAELARILAGHPEVELTVLTSRQYAGVPFAKVYPALSGFVRTVCEDLSVDRVCERTDLLFFALPHKLSMEIVPQFVRKGKRAIDLSADFRFADAAVYERAYQPHTAKEMLDISVYGLSEIYADRIKEAVLVGNPGCYPTSVLLPLIPLARAGVLDLDGIIADSKSGVSGAGRSLAVTSLFSEVSESFKPYKVGGHRHAPEMEEILKREAGKPVDLTFVPHLIPLSRGMLSTIYVRLTRPLSTEEIRELIGSFYRGRRFIRLREDGRPPDTLHVRGTNFCDIGLTVDASGKKLILMSAIDNLVKGASGQAVQNMNLMLGIDETTGLMQPPLPL